MVIVNFDNTEEEGPPMQSHEVLRYYDERKYLVRELSVDNNMWQDNDVASLGEILSTPCDGSERSIVCLERLSLSSNSLTKDSGDALAKILQSAGSLQELDLSNNRVQADGLEKLKHTIGSPTCTLQTLNLFNNRLDIGGGDKHIAYILRNNRSITRLNLGKNRLQSKNALKKIGKALVDNPVLRHLDLSHNRLGDAGAGQLASILDPNYSVCPLVELNLTGNQITALGVQEIFGALIQGSNRSLQTLNLSENRLHEVVRSLGITGVEVCAIGLKYSHTLQDLLLSSCRVGDEGVELLCLGLQQHESSHKIRKLDLSWNCIHDRGARIIAGFLEGEDVLQDLNLESNGIGCDGARALARALVQGGSILALKKLNLLGNQIRDAGAIALAEAICETATVKPEFDLGWEKNNNMTELGRNRMREALQYRTSMQTWLPELLRNLETQSRITNLRPSSNLNDEELIAICRRLRRRQQEQRKIRLPQVNFVGSELGLRSIRYLAQVLAPSTQAVPARQDQQEGPRNVVVIQRLYLQQTSIGDPGTKTLAHSLHFHPHLTVLTLAESQLTCAGARAVAQMLRHNRTLQRLDLKHNRIGDSGARTIFAALHMGDAMGHDLVDDRRRTTETSALYSLNLSHNLLTDESVRELESMGKITQFHLGNNLLSDVGALSLARACVIPPPGVGARRHPLQMERLQLSGNRMTERGTQALRLFLPPRVHFECGDQTP